MSTYPDYVARFYDVIYRRVRAAADKPYYVNKLVSCKGTSLEVGVGTGRIFLEALDRGADVYGADSSAEMLGVLLKKLEPRHRHRVFPSDLVTMELGKSFNF